MAGSSQRRRGRALAQDVLQACADQLLHRLRGRIARRHRQHSDLGAPTVGPSRPPDGTALLSCCLRCARARTAARAVDGRATRLSGSRMVSGCATDPCSPVPASRGAAPGRPYAAGRALGGTWKDCINRGLDAVKSQVRELNMRMSIIHSALA